MSAALPSHVSKKVHLQSLDHFLPFKKSLRFLFRLGDERLDKCMSVYADIYFKNKKAGSSTDVWVGSGKTNDQHSNSCSAVFGFSASKAEGNWVHSKVKGHLAKITLPATTVFTEALCTCSLHSSHKSTTKGFTSLINHVGFLFPLGWLEHMCP